MFHDNLVEIFRKPEQMELVEICLLPILPISAYVFGGGGGGGGGGGSENIQFKNK